MNSAIKFIEYGKETLKIILNNNLPSPKRWDNDKLLSFGNHKVFLGYLNAFFDHCPIKVSPNILWQLILNAFSKYINDNSAHLRNKFVNFEGKKEIILEKFYDNIKDIKQFKEDLIKEYIVRKNLKILEMN